MRGRTPPEFNHGAGVARREGSRPRRTHRTPAPQTREDPGSWPLPRSSAVTPRAGRLRWVAPRSLIDPDPRRKGIVLPCSRRGSGPRPADPPASRPAVRALRSHARTRAEAIREVRRHAPGCWPPRGASAAGHEDVVGLVRCTGRGGTVEGDAAVAGGGPREPVDVASPERATWRSRVWVSR